MRLIRFIGVLFLQSCAFSEPEEVIQSAPDPEFIAAEDRACANDEDCVITESGCCPCSSAGALTAINSTATNAVDDRRQVCEDRPCPDALSNDNTCCAARAECVNAVCELFGIPGRSIVTNCEGTTE
jgi:hypothetical protein